MHSRAETLQAWSVSPFLWYPKSSDSKKKIYLTKQIPKEEVPIFFRGGNPLYFLLQKVFRVLLYLPRSCIFFFICLQRNRGLWVRSDLPYLANSPRYDFSKSRATFAARREQYFLLSPLGYLKAILWNAVILFETIGGFSSVLSLENKLPFFKALKNLKKSGN